MSIVRKHTKGFTLMEVLICIAMIGILFAPLLIFFPESMEINNSSKNMQRANTIAQKIVEEVRAYDSIAAMCSDTINLTRTDDTYVNVCSTTSIYSKSPIYDWTGIDDDPFQNKIYYFVRNVVESDGQNFVARIKVDTTNYTASQVQDVPMLSSLGSDSTVMAIEQDETKSVINEYQRKYVQATGNSISKSDIAQKLQKTVKIEVTDSAMNGGVETIPEGMVRVQIYNEYSSSIPECGGKIVSDKLYNEEVKYEDLKGIYLFYSYDVYYNQDILTKIDMDVKYPVHGSAWKADYKLYAVCQGVCNYDDGDGEVFTEETLPTMKEYADTHQLCAQFSVKYNGNIKEDMSIWSNFKSEILLSDGVGKKSISSQSMDDIVSYIKEQRLADITVTVYKEGDFSKPVVEITSTRGE